MRPFLFSRIEKGNEPSGFWIDGMCPIAFAAIASTGESKIVESGFASLAPGNNVIRIEWLRRYPDRASAIFASPSGALFDQLLLLL